MARDWTVAEEDRPETTLLPNQSRSRYPALIARILDDQLVFRPAPPGDVDAEGHRRLQLPLVHVDVGAEEDEINTVHRGLKNGALSLSQVQAICERARTPTDLRDALNGQVQAQVLSDWNRELNAVHQLDELALIAIKIVDRAQASLLDVEPLSEIRFRFSDQAKAILAIAWEAMSKRGQFPLPPRGANRLAETQRQPCGTLHFVSASDADAGYLYTMGIALSPEAQALGSMDVTYGLDGELIVPGQAVSPIPPFLALATRLFAVSIPTSSNISEEVQSIPIRNFPHPTSIDDLEPRRGGKLKPPVRPRTTEEAITDLAEQLSRYRAQRRRTRPDASTRLEGAEPLEPHEVGATFDVTGLNRRQIERAVGSIFSSSPLDADRSLIALYLDIEPTSGDRVALVCEVIDAARALNLRYVAVADDVEDSWLPNLLEYLEPDELNAVADYADANGVIVIDGRPVDPVYTAATAAQRIQSVYTTLSVDILKMGMWLCLDALTARKVWQEILSNPHIPSRMLLMPIGIVEPWSAFVDNRDPEKTPRAILDPFEKIKFMIEEASALGMPSLLTDTRHKETWVLLGQKTPSDEPHVRERFVFDPATGEKLGRANGSAIPLLTWEQFMQCERLARHAGILLGQAGSIEVDQAFRIITETTHDAARDGLNPSTAIWTAETERVLRTSSTQASGDLQSQRSSDVSPFLAVTNRGYESHAKLDGWLRYLAEVGDDTGGLRQQLEDRRAHLDQLLVACLQSQRHDPSRYQQDWDAYRREYITYHNDIKANFRLTRDKVAERWATATTTP